MADNSNELDSVKFTEDCSENISIFSEYIRTEDLQLNRLDTEHFDPTEIVEHYKQVSSEDVILPIIPTNVEKVHQLFDSVIEDWTNSRAGYYGIIKKGTHDYIGGASIGPVDWQSNSTEISFRVSENGDYVIQACKSLCHFCFYVLGLEVVSIRIRKSDGVKSEYADKFIREFNGEYEGLERSSESNGSIITYYRWSVTSNEFYNDDRDYSEKHIEFGD